MIVMFNIVTNFCLHYRVFGFLRGKAARLASRRAAVLFVGGIDIQAPPPVDQTDHDHHKDDTDQFDDLIQPYLFRRRPQDRFSFFAFDILCCLVKTLPWKRRVSGIHPSSVNLSLIFNVHPNPGSNIREGYRQSGPIPFPGYPEFLHDYLNFSLERIQALKTD